MNKSKILFIDRDGTLIKEPDDKQVDSLDKLELLPYVIPALIRLKKVGYRFVMVTNQDGLGTASFPRASFDMPQAMMVNIFASQGILFDAVKICPHFTNDNCQCRKPRVGLLLEYLVEQNIDRDNSYVIGDRETDMQLAVNMGLKGIRVDQFNQETWNDAADAILLNDRKAIVKRKTSETDIVIEVNLDKEGVSSIDTGIGFFNHMLEQIAKHGGFSLSVAVRGDLDVDDHHTVEDTAIVLGESIRQALGDKRGIGRYGYMLPMDESLAQVALDLSGRPYFVFNGKFVREKVNDLSTELVPHFFRSLSEALKATLHIDVCGENTHHMIESVFKAVGRALRQAIRKQDDSLPSTKGVL